MTRLASSRSAEDEQRARVDHPVGLLKEVSDNYALMCYFGRLLHRDLSLLHSSLGSRLFILLLRSLSVTT